MLNNEEVKCTVQKSTFSWLGLCTFDTIEEDVSVDSIFTKSISYNETKDVSCS